jgi:hypothetical protein
MPPAAGYEIDDEQTFEENLRRLGETLSAVDPQLAAKFKPLLDQLAKSEIGKDAVWDALQDAAARGREQ